MQQGDNQLRKRRSRGLACLGDTATSSSKEVSQLTPTSAAFETELAAQAVSASSRKLLKHHDYDLQSGGGLGLEESVDGTARGPARTTTGEALLGTPPPQETMRSCSSGSDPLEGGSLPFRSPPEVFHYKDNNFLTCECCFADDFCPEECVSCVSGGHVFCRYCVKQYISNLTTGQFGTELTKQYAEAPGRLLCFCSTEDCDSFLPREALETLDVEGDLPDTSEPLPLLSPTTENDASKPRTTILFPTKMNKKSKHLDMLERWWLKKSVTAGVMKGKGGSKPTTKRIIPVRHPLECIEAIDTLLVCLGEFFLIIWGLLIANAKSILFRRKAANGNGERPASSQQEQELAVVSASSASSFSSSSASSSWSPQAATDNHGPFGNTHKDKQSQPLAIYSGKPASPPSEPIHLCPFCGQEAFLPPPVCTLVVDTLEKKWRSLVAYLLPFLVAQCFVQYYVLYPLSIEYGFANPFVIVPSLWAWFSRLVERTVPREEESMYIIDIDRSVVEAGTGAPAEAASFYSFKAFSTGETSSSTTTAIPTTNGTAFGSTSAATRAGAQNYNSNDATLLPTSPFFHLFTLISLWSWIPFPFSLLFHALSFVCAGLSIDIAEVGALYWYFTTMFLWSWRFLRGLLVPKELAAQEAFFREKYWHDEKNFLPTWDLTRWAEESKRTSKRGRKNKKGGDLTAREEQEQEQREGEEAEEGNTLPCSIVVRYLQSVHGQYAWRVLVSYVYRKLLWAFCSQERKTVAQRRAARAKEIADMSKELERSNSSSGATRSARLGRRRRKAANIAESLLGKNIFTRTLLVSLRRDNAGPRVGLSGNENDDSCRDEEGSPYSCQLPVLYAEDQGLNYNDDDGPDYNEKRVPQNIRCRNPNCAVLFCSLCHQEAHYFPNFCWAPTGAKGELEQTGTSLVSIRACPHISLLDATTEASRDSFIQFVSEKMSQKKVRYCPDCGLQFTKQDGCNKMKCPECACVMCYVCRTKLTGYHHFCQHPLDPSSGEKFCRKCDKCPLWKDFDDQLVKQAGDTAVRMYEDRFPDFRQKIFPFGTRWGKGEIVINGASFWL
ncbi:unnamed protein product [Amoebophrya sp. A25]|nr:unnamed protein product [Amoebophrya sp. A25]|eukprot:GSA25T00006958001.1